MRLATSLAFAAVLCAPFAALASTINISSTGQGSFGSQDSNYTVSYSASSTVPSANSPANAIIIDRNPGWIAAAGGAQYIGPTAGSAQGQDAGGFYTYTTAFTLPVSLLNATLTGSYAADNAASVYLNGVFAGSVDPYAGPSGFGFQHYTSFTLTSGFTPGVNTLQFVVENGNGVTDINGPTGLIANVSGSSTVTPEPSSIALLGTGLLGVAGTLRRRFQR